MIRYLCYPQYSSSFGLHPNSLFLRDKTHGWTNGPTDGQTNPFIELWLRTYNQRDDHQRDDHQRDDHHVMNDNPNSSYILLLDMNCNLYETTHVYSRLLLDLIQRFSLVSAYDLIPNFDPATNYTRCDIKTNSYTLIDGILISKNICGKVSNVRISHYGDNISDHSPVELDLSVQLTDTGFNTSVVNLYNKISWLVVVLDKNES